MNQNVQLIWKKIEHLRRMRSYLDYSLAQTQLLVPIGDWQSLAQLPRKLKMQDS